jgi:hypothetical protein
MSQAPNSKERLGEGEVEGNNERIRIMTNKQLISKMLLVTGLVLTILVFAQTQVLSSDPIAESKAKEMVQQPKVLGPVPLVEGGQTVGSVMATVDPATGARTKTETYLLGPKAGTTAITNYDGKGTAISWSETSKDGTVATGVRDSTGGGGTNTIKRPDGTVETLRLDPSNKVVSDTIQTTSPDGSVTTQTIDPKTGKVTVSTIKDSQGNVTTTTPDGKGGVTQSTTNAKTGNVTYKTPDGTTTVTDKNGVLISTTTVKPNGKGGFTSVTTDNSGKVISKTTTGPDGKVVSQTGQNKKFSKNTGAQSTGGMQASQGSGKHKDKHMFENEAFHQSKHKDNQNFQTDFFHQAKEKSNFQDSGSSGASSGSGQSHHHGRR